MAEEIKISETELLYDPLFDKKPDVDMKGKEHLPFKIVFIVLISIFVGISLYLSFYSISTDKYTYKTNDTGFTLYQFNGQETDKCLFVDYVRNEDGSVDTSEKVTKVREFAMSCNEYIQFIFIGKDVSEIEPHSFYYTKNLLAVIVDPENEYYTSVDGVLYNKDMTEIILHPVRNHEYRTALKMGIQAPTDEDTADTFLHKFSTKIGDDAESRTDEISKEISANASYKIPDTVTKIADSCFSDCEALTYVEIPSSVKEVGALAFFKCKGFETITIPDGVETIGPDGFSYCENVTYIFIPESVKTIGHHAFYGCLGCEKIYLAAENEDSIDCAENWLPKQSTRSMKDIEAVYGQERRKG